MIFWHGISSDDVHLIVEHYPRRPIPKRKGTRYSVPGRNGDIIIQEDAWENILQPYDIYISAECETLPLVAKKAVEWLMVSGYQILEDDYDMDTYRMAVFIGGVDLVNTLNMFGRASINFDCMPQRFFKSGAQPISASQGDVLVNPSIYTAKPLIVVQGEGSGQLSIGEYCIQLKDCNEITLDCENEEAYRNEENLNETITGPFPHLHAGKSEIRWNGGIENVTIVPRWFTI